jgi:deoxyribose-phosphate aldolase
MDQNRTETTQPVISPVPGMRPDDIYEALSSLIDYVMLRPDLAAEELEEGCRIAREYAIRAVLVRPCDLETVARWLGGSGVSVAAAVGYPYGYSTTGTKLFEGRDMLRVGATELDFTLNASQMISRQFQHVETELLQITRSAHESGVILKIVYNNRFLADDLKIIATKIAKRVEADMISIDYRESDVALLQPLLKDVLKLKCAGPVDTLVDALSMRAKGFARIGCTNPAGVLEEWKKQLAEQAAAQKVSRQDRPQTV